MKIGRIITLALLLIAANGHAQSKTGIRFFAGSWKELLAEAKQSRQPIFIDVYTDWCGPCKRMEKEIFPLPEVGVFYNDHYICYRLNAEKGEGPALSKSFRVTAYPTWLFLNEDGTLRSRRLDYMTAAEFINIGTIALGKDSVAIRLAKFDQRFRNGDRNPAFLKSYLQIRTEMQLDNADVLNAYLQSLKQPAAEDLRFLNQNAGRTWSNAIPLIVAHLDLLSIDERKSTANDLFNQSLYYAWGDAIKNNDRTIADQAALSAEKIYPLLDAKSQLTCDHATLYHGKHFHVAQAVKQAGYRLAATQMAIDTNYARQQDRILYDQVMAPFFSGQQDSTKIPGFSEERKAAAVQFSAKTAVLLYEAADAFAEVLEPGDPALKDAAGWAQRAKTLLPNDRTNALANRLSSNE